MLNYKRQCILFVTLRILRLDVFASSYLNCAALLVFLHVKHV